MTDFSTPPPVTERAADAVQEGKDAATEVAQTAGENAQQVVQATAKQARDLLGEGRGNVRAQAGAQHQALVSNLRSLSSELHGMTQGGEQSGLATDLVSRAQQHVDGLANWMDNREPAQLLDELRSLGRRRPGTFLLGALAAGVVAGRLTRGVVASHTADGDSSANGAGATSGDADQHAAAPSVPFVPSAPPVPSEGTQPAPQLGYSSGTYGAPPAAEPSQGYGATSTYSTTGPR
jgi:hypothetical protein